jgi:hypothetical protein
MKETPHKSSTEQAEKNTITPKLHRSKTVQSPTKKPKNQQTYPISKKPKIIPSPKTILHHNSTQNTLDSFPNHFTP